MFDHLLSRHVDRLMKRPKFALTLVVVVGAVTSPLGLSLVDRLQVSSNEFNIPGSQSMRAGAAIEAATGVAPAPTIVALVHTGPSALSAAGRRLTGPVERIVAAQPGVAEVASYERVPAHSQSLSRSLRLRSFVSYDRHWSIIAAALRAGTLGTSRAEQIVRALESRLPPQSRVMLGGSTVAGAELGTDVRHDLETIELWVLPILALLLLAVFRRSLAAVLPLAVAVITVSESLTVLHLLYGLGVGVSLFALTTVTGLSLGLGIDYSLVFVSRLREERARHDDGRLAVRATVLTAGRTISYSAIVITTSLAALMVFPTQFLFSVGLGASLCALIAAANALVLLPAASILFGSSLDARRRDHPPSADRPFGSRLWRWIPETVVEQPGQVAISVAVVLIVLGIPALRMTFRGVSADTLPSGASAREVGDILRQRFSASVSDEFLTVIAHAPADREAAVRGYAVEISDMPGAFAVGKPRLIARGLWEIGVVANGPQFSLAARGLVQDIRRSRTPFSVEVNSPSANFLDQQASLRGHLALALLIIAASTFLALFYMTGSIVIPAKTLVMNLLTFTATFGLLVLIFQEGDLAKLVAIPSQGGLEATQPILMFAAVFGLSTDYNLFVISRILEARRAGLSEREAIIAGVRRSGPVVTAAALLFCVTIGAFETSDIILVKEVSLGMVIAVAIDATLVRLLLMPSLMTLLGKYNWWAPDWLQDVRRWPRPASKDALQTGET